MYKKNIENNNNNNNMHKNKKWSTGMFLPRMSALTAMILSTTFQEDFKKKGGFHSPISR